MADINQLITLGVGTPADITHLVLFGLNIGAPEVVVTPSSASMGFMRGRTTGISARNTPIIGRRL